MKTLKKFPMKTLTTIFGIFFTTIIFAQDFSAKTKGTYLAGGSIYIDSRTDKVGNNKSTSFTTNINPRVGYFIKDNIVVGAELGISTSSTDAESGAISTTANTNIYGLILLGRYYFKNNFFGELAPGFGSSTTEQENFGITNKIKSSFYGARVGAGYAFFLGKNVALEPTFNYRWESYKPEGASSDYKQTVSSIFLGIGLSAYF